MSHDIWVTILVSICYLTIVILVTIGVYAALGEWADRMGRRSK